jgi:hypothetical protein
LKFWSRAKVVFGGAKAPRVRKNCSTWDNKVANGCILSRTGKPKKEIPV